MPSYNLIRTFSLAIVVACAGVANAGVADFFYDQIVSGPVPPGTAPFAQLHMVDNGLGDVDFTLTNLFSTSAADEKDIFLTELLLNVSGGAASVTFDNFSPAAKLFGSVGKGSNSFTDAGYKFDADLNFQTSNAGGGALRLKAGQSFTFSAHASGLLVSSFQEAAGNSSNLYSMVHFQGLPGAQSVKIAATDGLPPTPEPASIAAIAFGLIGLARRRKS